MNRKLVINWEDPANKTWVSWARSVLVRSTTRVPTSISDGTTLVTSTTRDQYKTTWYTDSWLTAWTTYYYNVFAVWDNDEVIWWVWVSGIPLSAPTLEYILVWWGWAWWRARCHAWWWGWAWCTASSLCCLAWWNWCQWVFIARYPANCWYNISWWCKYECNWYCIHCFTQDWTLTVN